MVNHRVIRLVVAFAIGISLALWSYQLVTDPEPARERALEEAAVFASREIVRGYLSAGDEFEIVDPLAPDRVVGKTYVYPEGDGWQVSGYYRRQPTDRWHPFLATLATDYSLVLLSLKDGDPGLGARAADDPRLSVTP